MTGVMILFGVLLATSLVYGAITSFGVESQTAGSSPPKHALRTMVGFELMDVVVIAVGLMVVGRPPRRPRLGTIPTPWVWAAAVLGIVAVVGINHGYHTVLRTYLGVRPTRDAVVAANGITPLLLIAYCVEPALVEELFFRYLALDTLRGVTSVHLSVAISSLMFGMAHIGAPLSIPMLALVGVPLAYARVASGSLALPMVLHFLHNLLVVVRS
jgi:membrane protease YdiL (CAAX protease family)